MTVVGRVKNSDCRLRIWPVVDERRPHHMTSPASVHSKSRTVLGTTFALPFVFADADRRAKRAAAVMRLGERHVAHVLWIHVTPRQINVVLSAHSNGGLAA